MKTLLYRGVLSSCTADCGYCPFAKHRSSPEELARDQADLARFVDWIAARAAPTRVFFTPWGEALVRAWYRDAVVALSRMCHVERVAVQTNLMVGVDWVAAGDPGRMGFWATWHPGELALAPFVRRLRALHRAGVHVSAGIVGLRAHLAAARALRAAVPSSIYVWVNRARHEALEPHELAVFHEIDPLFGAARDWPSRGRACATGDRVLSVRGDGTVQRCWFTAGTLGNLYEGRLDAAGPCPAESCHCHMGYVHLEDTGLREVFGDGILERVPASLPVRPRLSGGSAQGGP